jgi:hypothetical protein
MAKTISIITRLHTGISGHADGEPFVEHTYSCGPRNLLRAINDLGETRRNNRQGYGNMGCGSTWIAINGTPIRDEELSELEYETEVSELGRITRTEWARNFIASVLDGSLLHTRTAREERFRLSQEANN